MPEQVEHMLNITGRKSWRLQMLCLSASVDRQQARNRRRVLEKEKEDTVQGFGRGMCLHVIMFRCVTWLLDQLQEWKGKNRLTFFIDK